MVSYYPKLLFFIFFKKDTKNLQIFSDRKTPKKASLGIKKVTKSAHKRTFFVRKHA